MSKANLKRVAILLLCQLVWAPIVYFLISEGPFQGVASLLWNILLLLSGFFLVLPFAKLLHNIDLSLRGLVWFVLRINILLFSWLLIVTVIGPIFLEMLTELIPESRIFSNTSGITMDSRSIGATLIFVLLFLTVFPLSLRLSWNRFWDWLSKNGGHEDYARWFALLAFMAAFGTACGGLAVLIWKPLPSDELSSIFRISSVSILFFLNAVYLVPFFWRKWRKQQGDIKVDANT